jgi:hypothetical protein
MMKTLIKRTGCRVTCGLVAAIIAVLVTGVPLTAGAASGIAISVDRELIDYGDILPGSASSVEEVTIENTSASGVSITVEIQASNATARGFYEQSLYLDDVIFEPGQVISLVEAGDSREIATQLKVPISWDEPGFMEATLIFWAEADE